MRNIKLISLMFALLGVGADVITVTSGTVGNAGNVAASLITYLSAKLLEVAELNVILDQFGVKEPLPAGSSKTIRFVREEKLPVSTSPSQLTEGIPPDARGITLNQVEATAEQYGDLVRISDLAELTAKHDVVQRTIYMLGLQAAELYDQLIYTVLDAASNSYRPNSKAADTNLTAADKLSYVDLVQLAAILSVQGGRPFEGGDYVIAVHPQVFASLQQDPDWKASVQFGAPDRIWRGEVGMLAQFRVVKTNSPSFVATAQAGGGQASKVYSSFALARFAYHITDLQNLRFYQVGPGGHTDPLQQSRKMGWKFMFKTVITNQNWIRRVRTAGADSVTN